MSHDVTGHEPSAAPTRGASLPQAYVELLSRLEDMDVYVHQITQHWPKWERHGLAAQVRYMDDFVLIAPDKTTAACWLDAIADELAALGLRLNPKSGYWPLKRGVDFCGYRIWTTHIRPRRRAIRTWKARFRRLADMLNRFVLRSVSC